jgi:plastocyanin
MSTGVFRVLFFILFVAPFPAIAGTLSVEIADSDGAQVADAVVTLKPANNAAPAALKRTGPAQVIDQRDEKFIPLVTLLQLGGEVVFKNSDRTRHHVYSFSSVKPFEFVLNPGKQSPPVTMDQPGVAAIGCNIHDRMVAYIFVSDTSLAALSGADGRAIVSDVPNGTYTAKVWHPRLKSGDVIPEAPIEITDGDASTKFTLSLSAERPHSAHRRDY